MKALITFVGFCFVTCLAVSRICVLAAPGDIDCKNKVGSLIKVYRGIDVSPEDYDPRFQSPDHGGRRYVSDDLSVAVQYAYGDIKRRLRKGEKYGIVLELLVPTIALTEHSGNLILSTILYPDLSIVTQRVGLVRLSAFALRNWDRIFNDPTKILWKRHF